MSVQNNDFEITRQFTDEFIDAGEPKELRYRIQNNTKHRLLVSNFAVKNDFSDCNCELIQGPPAEIGALGSADIIVKLTVPSDYDQLHDDPVPIRFVGTIKKIME